MEKGNAVIDALYEMHLSRPGIAQFVFFGLIQPEEMIKVRKCIVEFKEKNPKCTEIDFIINSPGGQADQAYRIIRTLRQNFKKVNVIIPFWAKSAATLLALGANEIIMDEFGEFGPLDAQIGKEREDSPEYDRESALNDEHSVSIIENRFKMMYESMYIRIYEHPQISIPKNEVSKQLLENISKFFNPLLTQIDPYKLGEKKRMLDIGAQYAKRILLTYGSAINEHKLRELVDYLINECPHHGYVIDFNILRRFVSNVRLSKNVSDAYYKALQKLSICLLETEDPESLIENPIGFLEFQNDLDSQSDINLNDILTENKLTVSDGNNNHDLLKEISK
jgi:hypothetical protein